LGSEDLLIALPTSCGKTLIGELAGVGTALRGRRAVFSVPLKAIAREKYETFERRYSEYGLRVRLATGEFTEHLKDLSQGSFDIAVVIHEKLKHLILQNPNFLSGIGVVVLDELQGVSEENRGPNLEFLLGLLKNHRPRVRRVGLAGKLSSTDPLVEDFEGRVLSTHARPVDLHEGIVLANDSLAETALSEYGLGLPIGEGKICIYRSHNSQLVDATRLPVSEFGDEEEGTFLNLAAGLAHAGETVLVFLSTRREAEQAALFLSESTSLRNQPPTEEEIESIRETKLASALRNGVAYHHADCSAHTRSLVEEWFRSGQVRILCCTSTLAQGVNLPAHNVLIHPYVWNRHGLQGELTLLEESIVRNMAGRAGRLGLEEGQGRALLVAHSEREWDLYRSLYWTDFIQPNRPSLLLGNIESHLLAGIANGFSTEEDLSGFLSSLLSHRFIEGTAALRQSIEEALEEAEALGLAHCMASRGLHEKHWTLSSLGRVIALRGLSFETGRFLSDWLDRIGQDLPEPLTLLYAICSCGETQLWTWPRENNPQIRAAWCEEIRDRLGDEALETLGDRETLDNSLSRRLEDAAKMAMALEMWSEGESLENIQSEVTGISEGVLQSAGEGARWLLDSLGDIWRVRGNPSEGAEEIARLACSVGTGLPAWAILWNT
ncbi:MAG: DEAD/DEAH box helicase, partial [Candidatus Omnitrophica bacterium]|nr:DEAD/DEAH box helicase [Candidatus Omnitrophota bacterium]